VHFLFCEKRLDAELYIPEKNIREVVQRISRFQKSQEILLVVQYIIAVLHAFPYVS
jgi:hypothetical protein